MSVKNTKVETIFYKQWNNYRTKIKNFHFYKNYEYGINLVGYLQTANGLGEAARANHSVLMKTGIPFELIDYDKDIPISQQQSPDYKQKQIPIFKYRINLFHINPPQLPYLWDCFSPEQLSNHYNIGVWYWEMAEFPSQWEKYFNLVDEIWVASNFVLESIKPKSPIPIYLIPPRIEVHVNPNLTRKDFQLPEEKYLFLCAYDVFSSQMRKNPQAAIDAFKLAFNAKDQTV